jgi:hypothetical protein
MSCEKIVERMPPAGKPKLFDQSRDDGANQALVRAMRSDLTFVTFLTL